MRGRASPWILLARAATQLPRQPAVSARFETNAPPRGASSVTPVVALPGATCIRLPFPEAENSLLLAILVQIEGHDESIGHAAR